MRTYINSLYQEVCVFLKLNTKETTLIEYLIDFMNSGYMQYKQYSDGKYYWISYDKILHDIPILCIQKRQLGRILQKMEEKRILNIKMEGRNKIYIRINPSFLSGDLMFEIQAKVHHNELQSTSTKNVDVLLGQVDSQKSTSIDKLNKEKIYINIVDVRARERDLSVVFEKFLTRFKPLLTENAYKLMVENDLTLDIADQNHYIFSTSYHTIKENYSKKMLHALLETLDEIDVENCDDEAYKARRYY